MNRRDTYLYNRKLFGHFVGRVKRGYIRGLQQTLRCESSGCQVLLEDDNDEMSSLFGKTLFYDANSTNLGDPFPV